MSRKANDTDLNNAVRDYIAGEGIESLAQRYHTGDRRLKELLTSLGLFRSIKERYTISSRKGSAKRRARLPIAPDTVASRYLCGESEKALAFAFGTNRNVIRARLIATGISPRNRSEAQTLRMTDIDARGMTTRQAHFAFGRGETELADRLTECGMTLTRQMVIHNYNVDIASPPVAVELHARTTNPMGRAQAFRERKRIKQLTDWGWHVIYIWVSPGHILTDRAIKDVVTFTQTANRNPAGIGQYRVIRGSGELVASGCGDLD